MSIPVYSGNRVIALCTPEAARRYADVPNAEVIRKRKTGRIVQINLCSAGDDSGRTSESRGNPLKYTYLEALGDPVDAHCHTLKRVGHSVHWPIFRAAMIDCLPEEKRAEIRKLFRPPKVRPEETAVPAV
jgi:hypothetical protein